MRNTDDSWEVICELAYLKDMPIHDRRHSFASRALALGVGLPMIGRLLGHPEAQTTERGADFGQHRRRHAAGVFAGGQDGALAVDRRTTADNHETQWPDRCSRPHRGDDWLEAHEGKQLHIQ